MAVHSRGVLAPVRRASPWSACCSRARSWPRRRARDPDRRQDQRLRQARRETRSSYCIRVPLAAMQEVDFPRRGPAISSLARRRGAAQRRRSSGWSTTRGLSRTACASRRRAIAQARVSLPSDRSFTSYEQALAHLNGPRARRRPRPLLEPAAAGRAARVSDPVRPFRIRRPARASTGSALRVSDSAALPAARRAPTRAFELHGDPGLVRLDPRWHQAALRFVESRASGTSSRAPTTCCSSPAW